MEYPSIAFWLLAAWGAASRGPALYYLFFGSWSFGALAVVPPALIGGTSLTPAWVTAVIVCVRAVVICGPSPLLRLSSDFRRFGLLSLASIYAVVSAVLLPRLFAGDVDVIVVRLVTIASPQPVAPSASNFTQTFYFLLTAAATVSLCALLRKPDERRWLLSSFVFGAGLVVVTGAVDFAASATGQARLLAPFRNAAYAMMTDVEVLDVKRVVGLMPEASTYSALCMSFLPLVALAPSAELMARARPWRKWALVCGLLAATVFSLSSGGFVGLGFFALTVAGVVAGDVVRMRRQGFVAAFLIAGAVLALLSVAVWAPHLLDRPAVFLQGLVVQKSSSSSFLERAMWNRVALDAFWQTHMLGVGMGSARASSWVYGLLSNIGLPGTALLLGFVAVSLLTPAGGMTSSVRRLLLACKISLVCNLFLASLSSTAVNYGLSGAWLLALAFAHLDARRRSAPDPSEPQLRLQPTLTHAAAAAPVVSSP